MKSKTFQDVEVCLILAKDLGYGDTYDLMKAWDEVGCILEGYSRAIRRSD